MEQKAKKDYLDHNGVSELWRLIKSKFAGASHTHAASDIINGTLPIARGGTGQASALNSARALGRGHGTCSTAAATAAKTVAMANFTRQSGSMVAVRFTYANTAASPTLNVNSTGAASMVSCYTNAAIVSGNITANMIALFVFDGTRWVLLNPVSSSTSKT